jgi:hypothetical protein
MKRFKLFSKFSHSSNSSIVSKIETTSTFDAKNNQNIEEKNLNEVDEL